jgi:hypothetical protein
MSLDSNLNVQAAIRRISMHGPDRVVIDLAGQAVSANRAALNHYVFPDIIFIRDDGWTLGAPRKFEFVAFNLWKDSWIAFIRNPRVDGAVAELISEYQWEQ